MNDIDNYDQAILSSGSAILGFIPTVLTLLGSTNDDLLRIHAQYPALALLLSITNISTVNVRLRGIRPVETRRTTDLHVEGSLDVRGKDLGPYKHMIPLNQKPSDSRVAITVYHCLALGGALVVIWQTVDLGRKAVLTWACWTDFYPVIWVLLSVLQHILAAGCLRLSLRNIAAPRNQYFGVWQLKLTEPELNLQLAHPTFAHWAKAGVELLSNVIFLYGTVTFSSLSLVSGVNAIKVLVVYGTVSAVTRITTAWYLHV
jgi:hypothetical protein